MLLLLRQLERRLEAQWHNTTKDIQSMVLELGGAHTERIEKLYDRQAALGNCVEEQGKKLRSHEDGIGRIEAELLLAKQDPPPRIVVDDDLWNRLLY